LIPSFLGSNPSTPTIFKAFELSEFEGFNFFARRPYSFTVNISFRPTDYDSDDDCEAIAKWRNNPNLRRLRVPSKDTNELPSIVTGTQVRAESKRPPSAFSPSVDEMAVLGNRIVGQITLIINPPHRKSTAATVAWPSIIIGEGSLRGRGIARRFGERVFSAARNLVASHLEAGVFEFNSTIRRLLEKAEFTEFARVENMTWRDGKSRADVRYQRPVS